MGVPNERVIPVNSDHSNICKFTGVGDEVYKLVLSQLKRLADDAVATITTESPSRSSPHRNVAPRPIETGVGGHSILH